MNKIFFPILNSALIYIDDVLHFSPNNQLHLKLLKKFVDIVRKNEIIPSNKKMQIASTEIEFFGMHLNNGEYQPNEHLAEPLLKFQNKNFSKKQL